jgi:hypothetical protein
MQCFQRRRAMGFRSQSHCAGGRLFCDGQTRRTDFISHRSRTRRDRGSGHAPGAHDRGGWRALDPRGPSSLPDGTMGGQRLPKNVPVRYVFGLRRGGLPGLRRLPVRTRRCRVLVSSVDQQLFVTQFDAQAVRTMTEGETI